MLLTVSDVADRLKISASCVYRLLSRGELTYLRIGSDRGRIRIEETAFQQYLDSQRVEQKRKQTRRIPPRLPLKHLHLPGSTD